ncbi:MerR family transcriptional regulator [Lysinibacillus sp. 38-6]|uniref:MerR family transcriptional regulator n=1 Tax=Lysinibacillus sp. 38-6 TaxID=3385991 RepID=UPI0039088936
MYTVKEVAQRLEMNEHTVRYYTDQGLVPSLKRDNHNIRLFDEASVRWLLCVKHLRHCGMPIEEIKTYINLCQKGDSTVRERYDIMRKQQTVALAQLEEAQHRVAYIEEKASNYLQMINGREKTR